MKKQTQKTEKTKLILSVDKKTKTDFAQLCEDVGLPMGAVVTALMNQAVRRQELRITSLDINGFTPREAAELLRRWEALKAMKDKKRAAELG